MWKDVETAGGTLAPFPCKLKLGMKLDDMVAFCSSWDVSGGGPGGMFPMIESIE